MIKVENIDGWGFEHAIRGMRNPLNSWDRSDSGWGYDYDKYGERVEVYCIGENDLDLMRRLYKAGTEHRKFMRQIFVSMDITAPLYWWKEADQFKVGTVTNSCSTMHTIHKRELTINDFSHDELENIDGDDYNYAWQDWIDRIRCLNYFRDKYNETKDKRYWRQIIEKLPSSFNQKRTITFNYENVANMIKQRSGHKLDEWRTFVEILKDLPYVREIMGYEESEVE